MGRSPWLVPLRPADSASRATIVFLPHAGGSASAFGALARESPPWLAPVAMQYPGRMHRIGESFAASLDELAAQVSAAVLTDLSGPVVLHGHSMGSLVAFEAARVLAAEAHEPEMLVVSGSSGPASKATKQKHELEDAALVDYIVSLGGTDRRLLEDAEMRMLVIETVRADYTVLNGHRYRPGPLLHCPVVSVNGSDDPVVAAGSPSAWAEITRGPFTDYVVEGAHFFVFESPRKTMRLLAAEVAKVVVTG